jgi:DNA-directed RNA polymerase specialized sigma24 family protein
MQHAMTNHGYGEAYQAGFERTVRFLVSRGAQRDCAQEIAQAAWARGWECSRQLREDSTVIAWVNSIALNVYRRILQRETLMEPLRNVPSRISVDSATIDLKRALNGCRLCERNLLVQHMRGFSNKDIARDEGVSETAIRIRPHRARRAARLRLENAATWRRPPVIMEACDRTCR